MVPAATSPAQRSQRNNLVLPRSPLLGRSGSLAQIQQILLQEEVGLLTLTGPGGIGKTRLALQAAANLLDQFVDGVYFVELAAIVDPSLVLPAIAQVLGVHENAAQPLLASVQEYLCDRQLLLVLDNFEQLLPVATTIAELLDACPRLKALVTSRSPLHLYGEHEFPVPPLALPDTGDLAKVASRAAAPDALDPAAVDDLRRYAAVDLFCRRASAVQPGFTLTAANALPVAQICIGLDGLPLAIELAAARVKLFRPATLLARLQERLALLTGGPQDVPPRQRTLRDEIAWSYNLLRPEEQALFRRLAVFAGGFTLEAAAAISVAVGGKLQMNVLDGIAALVDQSLVQLRDQSSGEPRFSLLETIRDYALEQLEASGEAEPIRESHARYCLALIEALEPELQMPALQKRAVSRLQAEVDNLRAAMAWSTRTQPAGTDIALRLAGALAWFGLVGDHVGEVRGWLMTALRQPGAPGLAQAKGLWGAGLLAMVQGDYANALDQLKQGGALYRAAGDQLGVARVLRELCITTYAQRDYVASQRYGDESVALFRVTGSTVELALALDNLAATYVALDKQAAARAMYEEEAALSRALEDNRGLALALLGLGWIASQGGDDATASAHLEQALALQRALGEQWTMTFTVNLLGEVVQRRGELARADSLYREGLVLAHSVGDRASLAHVLQQVAGLALAAGHDQQAARLFAAAAGQAVPGGGTVFYTLASPGERSAALERVGARLGKDVFAACWAEGQALTPAQAVDYALALPDMSAAAPASVLPHQVTRTVANPEGLTAREFEVLRLLAEGLTYAQIGEKMFVSRRTVNAHVTSIYGKLGVNNRAAAMRFALEHHLLDPR